MMNKTAMKKALVGTLKWILLALGVQFFIYMKIKHGDSVWIPIMLIVVGIGAVFGIHYEVYKHDR